MLKIGVTGGIGSGKSYFCKKMEAAGIPVFYADKESKIIVNNDETVKAAIKELFGPDAYEPDGTLDSKLVAEKIFGNTKLRNALNAIVHPAVKRRFEEWLLKQNIATPAIIIEAAILFESEFNELVDKVVVVTAPPKTRTERVMSRDSCDEECVKRRMKAQWPEKRKVELADYVINNGPQDDLNQQIFQLLKNIFDN